MRFDGVPRQITTDLSRSSCRSFHIAGFRARQTRLERGLIIEFRNPRFLSLLTSSCHLHQYEEEKGRNFRDFYGTKGEFDSFQVLRLPKYFNLSARTAVCVMRTNRCIQLTYLTKGKRQCSFYRNIKQQVCIFGSSDRATLVRIGRADCALFFAVWAYVVSIIVLQDLHVIHSKAPAYSNSKISNPKPNILSIINSSVSYLLNFMYKIEEQQR